MRLQQYLMNEEYECRIKHFGTSYEVFKNPSHKEIRELKTSIVKFIADNKDNSVYVWDVDGPLHEDAWYQMTGRELESDINRGRILPGYSKLSGGKLRMDGSDGDRILRDLMDGMSNYELSRYLDRWKWVNKYVYINSYLTGINEEYYGRFEGDYSGKKFTVFKNPSTKEIREAAGSSNGNIRFIADTKTGDVYIWHAMSGIHSDVWNEDRDINKGRVWRDAILSLTVLWGVAKFSGGKMVMVDSDNIEAGYPDNSDDLRELKKNMKKIRLIDADKYLDKSIKYYEDR